MHRPGRAAASPGVPVAAPARRRAAAGAAAATPAGLSARPAPSRRGGGLRDLLAGADRDRRGRRRGLAASRRGRRGPPAAAAGGDAGRGRTAARHGPAVAAPPRHRRDVPGPAAEGLSDGVDVPGGRDRGRRPRGARLQPRPRLLPRERGHQARPGRLLPRGRARHRQRAVGTAVHAAPLPDRAGGGEGPPEAAAAGGAGVGRDGAAALPAVGPHRRRAVRDRAGQRDLGGADVDRRVPPVEQPSRGPRAPRRVAHRPRPRPGVRLRPGPAGRGRGPRGARRARRGRVPQDQRRLRPARLRPGAPRPRPQGRTPRGAGLRPGGRATHPRRRHHHLVAQGP
ncbi:hypothetical protein NOCARDAX2BIS_300003 [Nocardioides sp. AX2bis]|nr:hypothetical protein NOCARDAX2BIS_300003 [Nocardioides sp. AX2bis]